MPWTHSRYCSTRRLPMPWSGRALFVELQERAQTIDDIAQALAQEQGDPRTSELRVWAAAVRACVESHARDMEIVNPWARLQPKQTLPAWSESPARAGAGMGGHLSRIFRQIPTLEGAPEHFESAAE